MKPDHKHTKSLGKSPDPDAPVVTEIAHDEPAAPSPPSRPPNPGWFKKGEAGPRLAHALYSDQHPAAAAIVAEVERFMGQQIADEGGDVAAVDLTARRGALVTYRGRIVHKNILKLAYALEERGLFDKRGKLRVAWLSKLESLIHTAVKLDVLLGLERRSRRVHQSPADWLMSLPESGEAPDAERDEQEQEHEQ